MSQSPLVFGTVCETYTFVRGVSKLAEMISFILGENETFLDSPEELRTYRRGSAVYLVTYHYSGIKTKNLLFFAAPTRMGKYEILVHCAH